MHKIVKVLAIPPLIKFTNIRFTHFQAVINRKAKRGATLTKMISNREKNKNWHFNLIERPPNAKSVFEKVHRPNKRQNVLDTLFIKNITDVLSTGEVAPDILGRGVEITGVKVSPCFKILNVYWQIPPDSYEDHEEITLALFHCAPRLRAELISRNVMGRVPNIFFVRDLTNAKIAQFENALKDADLGPEDQLSVIPDDEFTKDILKFRKNRTSSTKDNEVDKPLVKTAAKTNYNLPTRPVNMKSNVFGLNHDILMTKVLSARIRPKTFNANSAVISSEFFPTADLFEKIPGTPLQPGEDREKLLKQFQVERKMLKQQKTSLKVSKADFDMDDREVEDYPEDRIYEEGCDYVEEETPDCNFR